MSPQAASILTLFETLPSQDQQALFNVIAQRSQLVPTKRKNRLRQRVIELALIINENTPDFNEPENGSTKQA